MQSVNERPEHPARLFSLPLESLLGRLASWQPSSKQKCCWLAGLCVYQPGPVSLLKARGFITCLEVKLVFPKWAMGNFA